MSCKLLVVLFIFCNYSKWKCVLSDGNGQTMKGEDNVVEQPETCGEFLKDLDDFRKSMGYITTYLGGITTRLDFLERDISNQIEKTDKNLQKFRSNMNAEANDKPNQTRWDTEILTAALNQLDKQAEALSTHIQEKKLEIQTNTIQKIRDWQLSQVFSPSWPNMTTVHKDGGCGGILISDKGSISFSAQSYHTDSREFRCIWTIRANLYEKVAFILISGNLNSSNNAFLSLTPLKTFNKENMTLTELRDYSRTISASHLYILEGPVVFVTLISKYSTAFPNFILFYEGRGNHTSALIQYRHYHYMESEGEVDYPRIRDVDEYSPNEMVTFVINPQRAKFYLHIQYIDLEYSTNCQRDAFTKFQPNLTYYISSANPDIAHDFRYCMRDSKISQRGGSEPVDAFIVTFKSDESTQHTGFRFTWPF